MSSQQHRSTVLLAATVLALSTGACSKSNNLLLGRVEATVGTHMVIVTDCYRTNVPPPQLLRSADSTKPFLRFAPCVDADVVIIGDQLIVNSVHYGAIQANDTVMVDHGKVLVNGRPVSQTGPAE